MADPITIIGAVGALCNIIEVVNKTITTIEQWRLRWKHSDLYLISLASQLVALRAALTKIQEWMDAGADETHHQLTMDLDMSISCCKVLVDELDEAFGKFDVAGSLDSVAKLKIILGTGGLDELQKLLERQTNALSLLLTACNCKAISEQKQLLEKPKARKTLERAKADTASLIVHRDSTSRISRLTDNMSKISYIFTFDQQIFSSRVYEKVFRSALRGGIRKDAKLYEHNDPVQLVASSNQRAVIESPSQVHIANSHVRSMHSKPKIQKEMPVAATINGGEPKDYTTVLLIGDDIAAISMEFSCLEKPDEMFYFDPYTYETTVLAGRDDRAMSIHLHGCLWRLHNVNSDVMLVTWAHTSFLPKKAPVLVVVVDLCSYDHIVGSNTSTRLTNSLVRFRHFACLPNYSTSPILLVFSGSSRLASKLHVSPLQRFFLEFNGGEDVDEARAFIMRKFLDSSLVRNAERVTTCDWENSHFRRIVSSFLYSVAAASRA